MFASSAFLIEAWNNQTAGRRRTKASRTILHLPEPKLEALVGAELRTMARKRQTALTFATIAVLGIALVALFLLVGPPVGLPPRFAGLFYPIVIAMGIYVAAATQLAVPGMAALGKELDRLWILKSLPVSGTTVVQAKTIAILVSAPAVVAAVVLPLPILAGFPVMVTALIVILAIAACFALLALGIWVGGRHPNFDPNTQGLPDSIEMYNVFLAALVLAFVVLAGPAQVYGRDHVLGILVAILVADIAALILVLATRGAARRYEVLEAA